MLTCLRFLDFGLDQLDENSHTNSGGDAMGDGPDECITHPSGHNQMTTEGQSFYIYFAILCIASFVWWMHSYCVQFLDGSTHHDDNVMGDDNIMGELVDQPIARKAVLWLGGVLQKARKH
jgi:hypothetical protein